jgi:hypothetical protein
MDKGSRIEEARRRLRATRRSIGVAAGIAFLGLAVTARAAHPGTSHHPSSTTNAATSATSSSSTSDDGFFDDDGGGSTFSQSQSSAPQVQSGGS